MPVKKLIFYRLFRKATPIQLLVAGYVIIVLLFAFLLTLPVSTTTGNSQSFVDALFIATSGISTSGLSVVDIGSYYSLFGQIVLLADFQIGGLGYMTFFAFVAYILRRKLSLNSMQLAVESLAGPTLGDLKKYFLKVICFTLFFEGLGALFLTIFWMSEFSLLKAAYFGVFHSVSTFCTAGFALFPSSLVPYQADISVNMIIDSISIVGGIGFFVLNDLYTYGKNWHTRSHPRRLSVHSKLALVVTTAVLTTGTIVIYSAESWPGSMGPGERLMISSFQSISASTTDGFNSVDIGAMHPASLFVIILLMLIGASPGSTGGGIKTTTLGLLGALLWSTLRGQRDVILFKRSASFEIIKKAAAVFLFFLAVMIMDIIILTMTEKATFLAVFFEIASALGNTGLSMGITAALSTAAKLILTITMFIGRVGPLTIGFALLGPNKTQRFKYAEEEILVG